MQGHNVSMCQIVTKVIAMKRKPESVEYDTFDCFENFWVINWQKQPQVLRF